jgi:hypothetical protein
VAPVSVRRDEMTGMSDPAHEGTVRNAAVPGVFAFVGRSLAELAALMEQGGGEELPEVELAQAAAVDLHFNR